MLPSRLGGKHFCALPFCLVGAASSLFLPWGGTEERATDRGDGRDGREGLGKRKGGNRERLVDPLCSSRPPARLQRPQGSGSSQARPLQRASSCRKEETAPNMRREHAPLGSTCARGEHERSGRSEARRWHDLWAT